ncbi:MAG: hypothetical protein A2538_00275 [Candidatus Magasanikbacteria bacterium RIFOXYD2_FULL_41_14]|uniref:Putative 2'-deoxynucleoside 5'-phosphate N-hydrolase 1 n=1 Tax=Candidatus Magasanikbacteria bacterium RIFOXYD2_FULL_41_14 TaxID=1798709 RepID=A0A1F6PEK1_9BACT|nr:MAG: hypothetical protein A2538_00275 [Candidatus Magasanikbacteria bacterium RIFOXYD2_FULL_41_14]
MKIYFAASVRGGRELQPVYEEIVKILQGYGEVVNPFLGNEKISDFGETDLSKEEIHDRDLRMVADCDVLVAELTAPSLGVGYEIAKATTLGKRVVGLFKGENTYKLSAMIKGDSGVEVFSYLTVADLKVILEKVFSK